MKVFVLFAFLVASVYAVDNSTDASCNLNEIDKFFVNVQHTPLPKTAAEAVTFCEKAKSILDDIKDKKIVCFKSNVFRRLVRMKLQKMHTLQKDYCVDAKSQAKMVEMMKCMAGHQFDAEFETIKSKRVASVEKAITFTKQNLRNGLCASSSHFFEEMRQFIKTKCGEENMKQLEKNFGFAFAPSPKYCGRHPHSHRLLNKLDEKERKELQEIFEAKTAPKTQYKTIAPTLMDFFNKFIEKKRAEEKKEQEKEKAPKSA